ncbi:hypothetical protein [Halorubellus litoreus]|uniref:Uncharacterized protein n=1 Tax=Halorubellus litoreus TaxID=755308 RepID=A0ABD5VJU8_9EURY
MSYQDTIEAFYRGGRLITGSVILLVVGFVVLLFTIGGVANIVMFQDIKTGTMNLMVAVVLVLVVVGLVRLGKRGTDAQ